MEITSQLSTLCHVQKGVKRKHDVEDDDESLEKMARLYIEEAMSAALIRKCPCCSKPIVKSDGCSIVTCVCGSIFCFRCGCQVSMCRLSQCRAMQEPDIRMEAVLAKEHLRKRYPRLKFKHCSSLFSL